MPQNDFTHVHDRENIFITNGACLYLWKANKNTSLSVTEEQIDENWDKARFAFSVWNLKQTFHFSKQSIAKTVVIFI